MKPPLWNTCAVLANGEGELHRGRPQSEHYNRVAGTGGRPGAHFQADFHGFHCLEMDIATRSTVAAGTSPTTVICKSPTMLP